MTRTSLTQGRATVPGEWDITWVTPRFVGGQNSAGVIYCHPLGQTAQSVFADPNQQGLLAGISRNANVLAADFALDSWGNDAAVANVVQAMDWLEANGTEGPFTLVASSMGMATACATTLANPTRVAKIAGIIPLISIAWGQSLFPVSANAAYPPVYDDATDGPYHSPLVMAATLPADLPIHLWCGDIDTTAPLSLAQDFITARPQTGLTIMPGQVHGLPAIGFAAAEVIAFVRDATTN